MSAAPIVATYAQLAAIARALSPEIRFHSSEHFLPCSPEWLLNRCCLTNGRGDLTYKLAGPIYLPSSMDVFDPGPLDVRRILAVTASSHYGDGHKNEAIGLWPLAAPPGQSPHYRKTSDWQFSDYQLETLAGELTHQASGPGVPCFAHITKLPDGTYLISYYFMCAYNGALGPRGLFNPSSPPLAGTSHGGGFEQHVGDWMRIAALIARSGPLSFSLLGVEFDAHGHTTIDRTPGKFAFDWTDLKQVPSLRVYSALNSHEMYPRAGSFDIGHLTYDETDDGGVHWETRGRLALLSPGHPAWVDYNGRWGNNVHYGPLVQGVDILATGPVGPAFKSDWTRGSEVPYSIEPAASLVLGHGG